MRGIRKLFTTWRRSIDFTTETHKGNTKQHREIFIFTQRYTKEAQSNTKRFLLEKILKSVKKIVAVFIYYQVFF